MYRYLEIWITEHPDDPKVVFGCFRLLLETLENTTDIDGL